MTDEHTEAGWAFAEADRAKPEQVDYDLDRVLQSMVALHAEIPEDAFTAGILGTERVGNGIVIGDSGLVLTIGYLTTEAETIWLRNHAGTAVSGYPIGYDFETGFGLVQALGPLNAPVLEFGNKNLSAGAKVVVAGHGGYEHALAATVVGKRAFAGYWEYALDEAIFTMPAHPNWGGAALIGPGGRLYGVGSLFVQNALGGEQRSDGNMIVPIDLLPPILDDLLKYGAANRRPRPWMGVYAADVSDQPVIVGLVEEGPAHKAGLHPGDIVLQLKGSPIGDLLDFYRTVWDIGPAGALIPLTVAREGRVSEITIRSIDRSSMLKSPKLH
ncbi:MAG: S1C family serine protease [Rhodospirillaceae bacterium]|nr:S1C family serine protease [Rhodospirillaceae bacterium]